MRKLMLMCLGGCVAAAAFIYWFWGMILLVPSLIMLVLLIPAFWIMRKNFWGKSVCYILVGALLCILWISSMQTSYCSSEFDDQVLTCEMIADGYSEQSTYGVRVDGRLVQNGRTWDVRIFLNNGIEIAPGDRIQGTFRFRSVLPGGTKESSYYQGAGLQYLASLKGDAEVTKGSRSLRYIPVRLVRYVKEMLNQCMPDDAYSFAQALLLGDSSELDYETDTAFRVSGIRHVIAVSGLHTGILIALIMLLCGNNRYLTAIIGLPLLLIFAAMAGFSPSVCRAGIMMALLLFARLMDREYDPWTALATACMILIINNPFVVKSVSFQLSVASVIGIFLLEKRIRSWLNSTIPVPKNTYLNNLRTLVVLSVSVSISAMTISAPLSAYHFQSVSLIGVLTNPLVIWSISLIFYGCIITCIAGSVWLTLGKVTGYIIAWPIRYVLFTAKIMCRIPMACVYTQSKWIVVWLVFCYILIATHLIFRSRNVKGYIFAAAAALAVAMIASWLPQKTTQSRVMVLDVGQGQCILLQSEGHNFLIDCGGTSDTSAADEISQTLLSQSIYRLDGVALTHYDRDHSGALLNLLTRIQTDRILLPPGEWERMDALQEVTDAQLVQINNSMVQSMGIGKLTFYIPDGLKGDNENNVSALFQAENYGILITGDLNKTGEKALIQQNNFNDIQILIAGHHGSKNATSQELLEAVCPETVIISVGEGNSYGHPAQETLDRITQFGCEVIRTDQKGTIIR